MRLRIVFICLAATIAVSVPSLCAAETKPNYVVDLDAHRGKVVLLDFWASWCVPCRRSFPWMKEMHDKYRDDGLVIIAVNLDADANEAAGFIREYSPPFAIAYDPGGALARKFDVVAMPSSYVFDRSGDQVGQHLGFKVNERDEYEALLVETLNR